MIDFWHPPPRTGTSGSGEVNHGQAGAVGAAANAKTLAFPVLQTNQDVHST